MSVKRFYLNVFLFIAVLLNIIAIVVRILAGYSIEYALDPFIVGECIGQAIILSIPPTILYWIYRRLRKKSHLKRLLKQKQKQRISIVDDPTLAPSREEIFNKVVERMSGNGSAKPYKTLYANCAFCGKRVYMPYQCNYCGRYFCDEHRLPFNHDCPGLGRYKDTPPPPGGMWKYRRRCD